MPYCTCNALVKLAKVKHGLVWREKFPHPREQDGLAEAGSQGCTVAGGGDGGGGEGISD